MHLFEKNNLELSRAGFHQTPALLGVSPKGWSPRDPTGLPSLNRPTNASWIGKLAAFKMNPRWHICFASCCRKKQWKNIFLYCFKSINWYLCRSPFGRQASHGFTMFYLSDFKKDQSAQIHTPPSYWKLNWQWEGTLSPWAKLVTSDLKTGSLLCYWWVVWCILRKPWASWLMLQVTSAKKRVLSFNEIKWTSSTFLNRTNQYKRPPCLHGSLPAVSERRRRLEWSKKLQH